MAVPVTETRDDLQWGVDVSLGARSNLRMFEGALTLSAGPVYRFHGKDRVGAEASLDGVGARVGGRHEVGLATGVLARVSKGLSCGVNVHVPVYQRVGGIQLVESASGSVRCSLAFGLD